MSLSTCHSLLSFPKENHEATEFGILPRDASYALQNCHYAAGQLSNYCIKGPPLVTIRYMCLYVYIYLLCFQCFKNTYKGTQTVHIFLYLALFLITVVWIFSLFLANRASILLKFPFLKKGEFIPMSRVNTN